MKEFEVGSIFEFKSTKGYNYIQYAYQTEMGIPLVGVLERVSQTSIKDLSNVWNISYRYFICYHVASAVSQRLIRYVGMAAIPENHRQFPLLRVPGHVEANGIIKNWFIYNVPINV
jgi:hypothetical protein